MPTAIEPTRTRNRLILHDALAFLTLIAITIALFAVTLFLFRSFEAHRAELATRWASRGLIALQANDPVHAIAAYRTALAYAPDSRDNELMLAQSLARAGHTEEAYTYFLGLWESRPGDGFINLQLARLAATRRDTQAAINFYRASIYGTWEGDAIPRRREGRLELARYLIAQHDPAGARAELLIAGGNAPDTAESDLTLAALLEQAAAPQDALGYDQKALARDPKNLAALTAAGRLTFAAADYRAAHRLLERAAREDPRNAQTAVLLAQADSLLQLATPDSLPPAERVRRILAERTIARQRLADCTAAAIPAALQPLVTRWASPEATASRKALLDDLELQAATIRLINDTELATDPEDQHPAGQHAASPSSASQQATTCPTPTPTDTLLLLLAKSAHPD